MTTQPFMRISREENLVHLPFVYFLPEELIIKCPTLLKLPRKVREVIYNEEMMKIVNSDQFMDEVMDAVAILVFPHFGFRGWKEHYSVDFPVWKLSYLLGLWSQLLEREIGWGLQRLLMFSSSEEIPFYDPDYIKTTMKFIVKMGIAEMQLQPTLDAIKEMPCEEDFEIFPSNVKTDFYRSWYHSRTKVGVMMSIDDCTIGDDEDFSSSIIADPNDMANEIALKDFYQSFKNTLSEQDRKILELRDNGYLHEEIAEKLGYKNHSGVVKRMQAINSAFLEYSNKHQ